MTDQTDPLGAPGTEETTPPLPETEAVEDETNPGGADTEVDTAIDEEIVAATSPDGGPE